MRLLAFALLLCFCQARVLAGEILFDFGVHDPTPPTRRVNQTPPATVALLAAALDEKPVAARRVELVRDLGRCELPEAAPPLLKYLTDEDAAVRCEVIRALGRIGDRNAISKIAPALTDRDVEIRLEAIRTAAAMGDEDALSRGLDDSNDRAFAGSCALARTASHYVLIAKRLDRASIPAKYAAIRALGRSRDPQITRQLIVLLSDADIPVLLATLQSLAESGATDAATQVTSLLPHSSALVRRGAVDALARLATPEARNETARKMLDDPDNVVRTAALRILIEQPDARLLPAILGQLASDDIELHDTARNAIVAAARSDKLACENAAMQLLAGSTPEQKIDGSYILGEIRSEAGIDAHLKLLSDSDWRVVGQASGSLGLIHATRASALLVPIASRYTLAGETPPRTPEEMDAIADAIVACGRLGDKAILPVAKSLVPEKLRVPTNIRVAAIWTTGVLADASDGDAAAKLLSVLNDASQFEVEVARVEAAYALANQHRSQVLDALRKEGAVNPIPAIRFACHQAADALAGTKTEYITPDAPYVAETCIQPTR